MFFSTFAPSCSSRELHDKYVRLGERMEALVKEGKVLKSSASAETSTARTAVQVCTGQQPGGHKTLFLLFVPARRDLVAPCCVLLSLAQA